MNHEQVTRVMEHGVNIVTKSQRVFRVFPESVLVFLK